MEAEILCVDCRRCGRVRTEGDPGTRPGARPGARHTRNLHDVVAWLARRTDKTTIAKLAQPSMCRCAGSVACRGAHTPKAT